MKLDPIAREYVQQTHNRNRRAQVEAAAQAAAEPERETRLRPHETRRKPRAMNVTFPSETWTDAIRAMAKNWGLRPGDLIVWAVSYAIDVILQGNVDHPDGEGREQHHKAMEWESNLPWEPERNDTESPQRRFEAFEAHSIG